MIHRGSPTTPPKARQLSRFAYQVQQRKFNAILDGAEHLKITSSEDFPQKRRVQSTVRHRKSTAPGVCCVAAMPTRSAINDTCWSDLFVFGGGRKTNENSLVLTHSDSTPASLPRQLLVMTYLGLPGHGHVGVSAWGFCTALQTPDSTTL